MGARDNPDVRRQLSSKYQEICADRAREDAARDQRREQAGRDVDRKMGHENKGQEMGEQERQRSGRGR